MIKVGDMVEVVGHSAYYSKGDRFRVADLFDEGVVDGNDIAIYKDAVRLVEETEAEKRGAKFGVGGVIKATGDKGVFWKSSSSYLGEEWYLFMNDGNILVIPSTQIRLDHEPEYKEIPFSEATHEQRMDVSALRFDGTPVEQIFQFDNGEYMFTISACKAVANAWNILKVRIPT